MYLLNITRVNLTFAILLLGQYCYTSIKQQVLAVRPDQQYIKRRHQLPVLFPKGGEIFILELSNWDYDNWIDSR
jgi:hypothetical protein